VTVAETSDIDPCPCGDTTAGGQPITINPRVRAWSCAVCGVNWAVTVVNARPYLDLLTAAVDVAVARSVLRQVIALADQASILTDVELRVRLVALAGTAQWGCRRVR
jgi:hypothetical protein